EYYQTIFDNAYDAIFIESLDGRILDVNPAASNLTGYTRDELLSMDLSELLPAGIQMPTRDIIEKEIMTGGLSISGWNIRKDGSKVKVEVRVTSFGQDDFERIIVIVRDVMAGEEIQRRDVRQRLILESLHEMAVGLMQRHKLQDVLNSIIQHACQLFETTDGYFYMLSNQPEMIEIKVGCGNYLKYIGCKRQIGTGLSGRVWQSGEPMVIENYQGWDGRDRDPKWKEVETAIGIPLKSHGRVIGVIGLDIYGQNRTFCQKDFITFQRLAELASVAIDNVFLLKELNESREQFRSLFSNMAEGVALHDGVIDGNGNLVDYRIVNVNPKYSQLTGLRRDEVLGKLATELYNTSRVPYLDEYAKTVFSKETGYFETYFPPLDKYFSISVAPWKENGFATIFSDITERKQAEQKLLYMSYHDTLTGAYNRTYFETKLKNIGVSKVGLALVIADIDELKSANDMFGHAEGDRLLIKAATFLRENFRQGDIIARIGGDEFAVIMENVTYNEVVSICSRLRIEMDKLVSDDTSKFPLHMSLGFAFAMDNTVTSIELLQVADNKMYRDKIHRRVNSRTSIVQTLKQTLTECDYLTEGHGERLQAMVIRLAQSIGLADINLGDLKLFAQFHDIGKVGIPDSILHKQGPLSPEERGEMNRHCEIGQRIAQSSKDLLPIADWILKHHEHWNGEGYPLGLKGEEIPVECRILAIIDAYDAMTNDRPYRRALSHKDAVVEIERCAGTQFDPTLVQRFIEMLDSDPD
ncbi:MAG: diguanylate cyclase, partial [Bacillota bacterium]|nr:diguanylate cyclase [Bacillota bacterium]